MCFHSAIILILLCCNISQVDNFFHALELSIKSPSVARPISSAFAPYPLFEWYPQSKEILLNLGMKCWNSAFDTQGSRVIIGVVQVGAVKYIRSTRFESNYRNCTGRNRENICSSSGGAQEKGKTGRNWVYHQNWWKISLYVVAVEALRKKERQDETEFTTKIGGKSSFSPSYFVL
jgi:hypothetical protein